MTTFLGFRLKPFLLIFLSKLPFQIFALDLFFFLAFFFCLFHFFLLFPPCVGPFDFSLDRVIIISTIFSKCSQSLLSFQELFSWLSLNSFHLLESRRMVFSIDSEFFSKHSVEDEWMVPNSDSFHVCWCRYFKCSYTDVAWHLLNLM